MARTEAPRPQAHAAASADEVGPLTSMRARVDVGWIELIVKDEDGNPQAASFTIRLPNGSSRHMRTDEFGFARVEEIPEGLCTVVFDDVGGDPMAPG